MILRNIVLYDAKKNIGKEIKKEVQKSEAKKYMHNDGYVYYYNCYAVWQYSF